MSSKMNSLLDENWSEVVRVPYNLEVIENSFIISPNDSKGVEVDLREKPEEELLFSSAVPEQFFTVYGSNYYHDLAYRLIPENTDSLIVFDAHSDCFDRNGFTCKEPTFIDWVPHAARKVGQAIVYGIMPCEENFVVSMFSSEKVNVEQAYPNIRLLTHDEPFIQVADTLYDKKVHVSIDLDVCSSRTDHPLLERDRMLSFPKLKWCLGKILDRAETVSVDVCGIPYLTGSELTPEEVLFTKDPSGFDDSVLERFPAQREDYFDPRETIGMVLELKDLFEA